MDRLLAAQWDVTKGKPTPPQTPKTAGIPSRRVSERPQLGNISVDISLLEQNMNSWTVANLQRKWLTLTLLAQPCPYPCQWDFCYAPLAKAVSWLMSLIQRHLPPLTSDAQMLAHHVHSFERTRLWWFLWQFLASLWPPSSHSICSPNPGHSLSPSSGTLRNQHPRGWSLTVLHLGVPCSGQLKYVRNLDGY